MLLHVLLHLGLCGAVSSLPAETPVEIRVRLSDKTDRAILDRSFETIRGSGDEATVEFAAPWGVYRLEASVPVHDCNAVGYFVIQPKHDRAIAETLQDGPAPALTPLLLFGTGPTSFHEAKPQFVVLDGDEVACRHEVVDPLPARVSFEHQGDAYYATIDAIPTTVATPLLALRLQTPDHGYQYISLVPLRPGTKGWPRSIRLNFDQKQMSLLAGKPTDTLFCPPLDETDAG
jgi:hypothetical protein